MKALIFDKNLASSKKTSGRLRIKIKNMVVIQSFSNPDSLNSFLANVPTLYPFKTKNLWFSSDSKGYKIETLARNGLTNLKLDSHFPKKNVLLASTKAL